MFEKRSKLQIIIRTVALESAARRLASYRNRFPITGTYGGTYGGSFGWTGVP